MNIIPYTKDIIENKGAFLNPEDKMLFTYLNSEEYAKEYCEGYYASALKKMKQGEADFYLSFSKIANLFGYTGTLEDIDVYLSTSLTKEELELLKKWLLFNQNECEFIKDSQYSNFLIQVLGWSKIETVLIKRIITTSSMPYLKFWNYNLMGFNIYPTLPRSFNNKTKRFEPLITNEWVNARNNDELVKRECEKIKKKCLSKKERMEFFRK